MNEVPFAKQAKELEKRTLFRKAINEFEGANGYGPAVLVASNLYPKLFDSCREITDKKKLLISENDKKPTKPQDKGIGLADEIKKEIGGRQQVATRDEEERDR